MRPSAQLIIQQSRLTAATSADQLRPRLLINPPPLKKTNSLEGSTWFHLLPHQQKPGGPSRILQDLPGSHLVCSASLPSAARLHPAAAAGGEKKRSLPPSFHHPSVLHQSGWRSSSPLFILQPAAHLNAPPPPPPPPPPPAG